MPAKPGRGQLLGNGDDQEHEPGQQVPADPGALVAVERLEGPGSAHGDIMPPDVRQIDPIE